MTNLHTYCSVLQTANTKTYFFFLTCPKENMNVDNDIYFKKKGSNASGKKSLGGVGVRRGSKKVLTTSTSFSSFTPIKWSNMWSQPDVTVDINLSFWCQSSARFCGLSVSPRDL